MMTEPAPWCSPITGGNDSALSTQECGPCFDAFDGFEDDRSYDQAGCIVEGLEMDALDISVACSSRSKAPGLAAAAAGRRSPPASDTDAAEPADQDQHGSSSSPGHQQQRPVAQPHEELLTMIRRERGLELELCPGSCFLEQRDSSESGDGVSPHMRMIVTSWLSEVACEFNMQQETLFLAVALMDRFMQSSTGVPRGVLQLVAVACMLVASKQDEVFHPSVEELTDIAANCFQTQDLLRMERILLDSLAWRIKTPTAYTFLHLFTQATAAVRTTWPAPAHSQHSHHNHSHAQHRDLGPQQPLQQQQPSVVAQAAYLAELALLDYECLAFRPSKVAATALMLAQGSSPQGAVEQELQLVTGYCLADLHACAGRLRHLHRCAATADDAGSSGGSFAFIKDKYSAECWLGAALQPLAAMAGPSGSPGTASDLHKTPLEDEEMQQAPS